MVQDELSRAIVSTLTAYVAKLSADAAMRQPIERLAAYDLYLRGREMLREWVPSSDGGRCIDEARKIFRQGATADPRYARSLIGLSECDVCAWVEPSPYGSLMDDYQNAEVLNRALVFAQKAVSLDGSLDEARAQLGWVLHWKRRIEESVREYDRAFALNPNMTDRHYGNVLAKAGRALDAIAYIRDVMGRDPFHNEELLAHLGHALYLVEQYEEAAEVLRRCVRAARTGGRSRCGWPLHVLRWAAWTKPEAQRSMCVGSSLPSPLLVGWDLSPMLVRRMLGRLLRVSLRQGCPNADDTFSP